MYLRTTKVKRPDGKVDEYIRLVESSWNDGSPRHRVICNLGRKDLLAPHAEALLRLLKGERTPAAKHQAVEAIGAWDWGPMLVARHLWQAMGLEASIDSLARDGGTLAERPPVVLESCLPTPRAFHPRATLLCESILPRWCERPATRLAKTPGPRRRELPRGCGCWARGEKGPAPARRAVTPP